MTYICTTKGCSNTRCTKMYNISQFFTSTPHLTYFLQHLNSTLWRRKLWSQTKQNCLKWEENPENILKGEREYTTRQESSIDLNDASIKMNISINWSSAAFLELWEKGEWKLLGDIINGGGHWSVLRLCEKTHSYIFYLLSTDKSLVFTWGLGIGFYLGE